MDEARQKQLDLTVKNSTSFMSREKEVISKVSLLLLILVSQHCVKIMILLSLSFLDGLI